MARDHRKSEDGADFNPPTSGPLGEAIFQLDDQHKALSKLIETAPDARVTAAITQIECALAKLREAQAFGQQQAAEKTKGD